MGSRLRALGLAPHAAHRVAPRLHAGHPRMDQGHAGHPRVDQGHHVVPNGPVIVIPLLQACTHAHTPRSIVT